MTRSPHRNAFTLIEMITVIAIIAILAGLILSVNGLVQSKASRAKAEADIRALTAAITNYMTDNGGYPQTTETDSLDPRATGSSNPLTYKTASQALYRALIGDVMPIDGKTDVGAKNYAPDLLKGNRLGFNDSAHDPSSTNPDYIKDPFASSYGYSTAGLKAEQDYQGKLQGNPGETRSGTPKGYNPTFDLWSTGGTTDGDMNKWIKNW